MITSPIEAVERTIAIMDGEPRSMGAARGIIENTDSRNDTLQERVEALEGCFEETICFLNDLARGDIWLVKPRIKRELERLRDTGLFSFKVTD